MDGWIEERIECRGYMEISSSIAAAADGGRGMDKRTWTQSGRKEQIMELCLIIISATSNIHPLDVVNGMAVRLHLQQPADVCRSHIYQFMAETEQICINGCWRNGICRASANYITRAFRCALNINRYHPKSSIPLQSKVPPLSTLWRPTSSLAQDGLLSTSTIIIIPHSYWTRAWHDNEGKDNNRTLGDYKMSYEHNSL